MEDKKLSGQNVSLPNNDILLKAKVRIGVTRLFKNYLFAFEEFIDAHDEAMAKLKTALPDQYKEFVELADYLSDAKIEAMRKRVLGLGNDLIRDLDEQIDVLKINKKEKE
jgi:hypothetical protein